MQLARVELHGVGNSPIPATMVITQFNPRQFLGVVFRARNFDKFSNVSFFGV